LYDIELEFLIRAAKPTHISALLDFEIAADLAAKVIVDFAMR
jgi:hypothetical protein